MFGDNDIMRLKIELVLLLPVPNVGYPVIEKRSVQDLCGFLLPAH